MVCVGLLTRIRISGAAVFCASGVDAGLASGLAGLELVGASCDWVCISEPGVLVLGVWDSDPVWALAGKTSIAPTAARVSKRQCLRKSDTRTLSPVAHNNVQ